MLQLRQTPPTPPSLAVESKVAEKGGDRGSGGGCQGEEKMTERFLGGGGGWGVCGWGFWVFFVGDSTAKGNPLGEGNQERSKPLF